jgi:hypothetical protein
MTNRGNIFCARRAIHTHRYKAQGRCQRDLSLLDRDRRAIDPVPEATVRRAVGGDKCHGGESTSESASANGGQTQ